MDKLKQLFEMQTKLNNHTFEKQGITDNSGKPLLMETLYEEGKGENLGANSNTKLWLANYARALMDESRELEDELPWKWWSKDTLDMQNIRVEIVDQLHFLISEAITAGMTADDLFDIYEQKNRVNLARQNNGYNAKDKTEDDNKSIHSSVISEVTVKKSCFNCNLFNEWSLLNNGSRFRTDCPTCGSETLENWQPRQEDTK